MALRGEILARIRLMRRKLATTKPLMGRIGKVLVEASYESFALQRLGNIEWAAKYGGSMVPPFLNVAGALADFIGGARAPKKVQFLDRPALLVTGALRRSIAARVPGETSVEVYSPLPYAALMQEGGTSTQNYGEDVKDAIRNWLFTKKGASRKGREEYKRKLSPLLARDSLETQVIPRPFMGVTDEAEAKIAEEIRVHFEGRA